MGKAKVLIDLTGQRFGRWLVLRRGPNRPNEWKAQWICRCACGAERSVCGSTLRRGLTRGCVQCGSSNPTHGKSRTRTYKIWEGVKARCENPRRKEYPNYGGRGIKLCDAWQKFEGFYNDMGEAPPDMELDRIDNDGNYSPENCRWATHEQNNNNTRRNRLLIIDGETKTLAEWCRHFGVNHVTASVRISRGWAPERAVSTKAKTAGAPN